MSATANPKPTKAPVAKPKTKDDPKHEDQAPDIASKGAQEEAEEVSEETSEPIEPSPNEEANAQLREQSAKPKEKTYSVVAKQIQAILEAADAQLKDDAKMIGNRWTAGQPSGAPHDPENYSLVVRIPSVKVFAEHLNDAGLDKKTVKQEYLPQFRALLGMIGQWVNPKRNTAIVVHPWGAVPYMKFDDETIKGNKKG